MLRAVLLLSLSLASVSAFSVSTGAHLSLKSRVQKSQRPGNHGLLRMQNMPPESDEEQRNPLSRTDAPWFERTTALDREQRVSGDPLSPKKKQSVAPYKGQTIGNQNRADVEREGYEWYQSMEGQRSMFGRTLNPMTGSLEKKDESVPIMNPFTDPIFYVILIIGAPVAIMLAGAYSCVVPALSMALGAQCEF